MAEEKLKAFLDEAHLGHYSEAFAERGVVVELEDLLEYTTLEDVDKILPEIEPDPLKREAEKKRLLRHIKSARSPPEPQLQSAPSPEAAPPVVPDPVVLEPHAAQPPEPVDPPPDEASPDVAEPNPFDEGQPPEPPPQPGAASEPEPQPEPESEPQPEPEPETSASRAEAGPVELSNRSDPEPPSLAGAILDVASAGLSALASQGPREPEEPLSE